MKKWFAVLLTVLLMLTAAAGMASDSTIGKIRVFGYGDKVTFPENRYAPYAVALYKEHVDDRYLKFWYDRKSYDGDTIHNGEYVRHWMFEIDNEDGEHEPFGGKFELHLPYPSIWSAEQGRYWKWTKEYAKKHYKWAALYGDHVLFECTIAHQKEISRWEEDPWDYEEVGGTIEMDDFGIKLVFIHNKDTRRHDVYIKFKEK